MKVFRTMQWLPAGLLMAAMPFLVPPAQAADDLIVSGAYARATPPGSTVSSAYFNLSNQGEQERTLVGATTEVAGTVEIHTHEHDDEAGMHRMRRVEEVPVPAGAEVAFEPGGLHIMLLDLDRPLDVGEEIEIALKFDDDTLVPLIAEIRRPGREAEHQHHEMEADEDEELAPDEDREDFDPPPEHDHHRS